MAENLIICYSRTGENYVNGSIKNLEKGNSRLCAEYIKEAVGGEIFMVETIKSYPQDYYTCTDEAKKEQKQKERPELKEYLASLDGFENIFICGPCWWGTYPMAVFSLIEKLDWTGKRVFPLMTHEGSGLGSCVRDLKKACSGAAFGEGLAVHGANAPSAGEQVKAWASRQLA